MEKIINIASENQLAAVVIGFVVLLSVYFLFKSLIKIGLFVLIIVIAIGGYFYFQRPGSDPASMGEVFNKAKTGSETVVEKGKDAWGKGKKLVGEGKEAYEKGKETIKNSKEMLDKGAVKGMQFVEKVEKIVGKIFLFFEAKKDDDKQQKE